MISKVTTLFAAAAIIGGIVAATASLAEETSRRLSRPGRKV